MSDTDDKWCACGARRLADGQPVMDSSRSGWVVRHTLHVCHNIPGARAVSAMEPREVVARALVEVQTNGMCEFGKICADCDCFGPLDERDGYALLHADAVLAALAADPGVVERAARALVPSIGGCGDCGDWDTDEYVRDAARAALAAALTPEGTEAQA